MSAIEQRARELLAGEFEARGLVESARELRSGDSLASMEPGFAASVAAVIAALTPPEGDMGNPISVPDGFVLVSAELLEDLASEAESGIHQTVFVPAKRERRMAFVREARALIAASQEGSNVND